MLYFLVRILIPAYCRPISIRIYSLNMYYEYKLHSRQCTARHMYTKNGIMKRDGRAYSIMTNNVSVV